MTNKTDILLLMQESEFALGSEISLVQCLPSVPSCVKEDVVSEGKCVV